MRVGRGKQAFNRYAFVYFSGKTREFFPVHGLAFIFIQAPFNSGRLGRA
jgi:hypothetical protein